MDPKHQFISTSRRRSVFVVICLLVAFVGGDLLDCQETECSHPNVTNGMVGDEVMVTVPPKGDYGNYAQADEVESFGEYGNSDDQVIVKYSLNTRIKINCSQGHVFNGTNLYSGVVTCIKPSAGRCDVMWSGDPSSICTTPTVCHPIAPNNANLTETCDFVTPVTIPVPIYHTACVKCTDGYRMTDIFGTEILFTTIQCGPTGQWDAPVKCTPKACPWLTAPKYGLISSFDRYSLVEFSCNDNFLMVGSPTLICDRESWTGLPPLCRYKFSCLTNTLTRGVITVSPDKMGQGPWVRNNINATYGCETGFTNLTNTNILCVRGGWRPEPRCVTVMFCPALPQIDHGTLQFNHGRSWRSGSVYQYSCDKDQGYEFSSPDSGDSVELKCGKDETWSRGIPRCELVKCPPLSLPAHGTKRKLNHGGNNEYGAQFAVTCDVGYKLRGKEPSEEVIRVCQSDGSWSGQVGYCEDRKIFRSRQEWASFLSGYEYTCCPLRKQHWWSPSCPINSEITDSCLRGRSWDRPFKDEICRQEEVTDEAGDDDHLQIWYALLGVKVSKYGNRCCWVDEQNQPSYKCYESPPQSWL